MNNQDYGTQAKERRKEYKTLLKNKKQEYDEQIIIKKCIEAQLKPWEMFERCHNANTININILQEHFKTLLCIDDESRIATDIPHETTELMWYNNEININDLHKAISSLKNNKASGLDQIYNEHLKITFDYFQDWWLLYLNNLFDKGLIPDLWRNGKLKILYKGKGNINDPNMYRGIALTSVAYKLYTRIINNRIIENIDCNLPMEQYGFRIGKNCQQAISILRKKAKDSLQKEKGHLYCLFVDFHKAFDSVNRDILLKTLIKEAGIKGKILNAIQNIISRNFLKIDNGIETTSDAIEQTIGIIQGDPLSSTLFVIYVMSLPNVIKVAESINSLMYADDLVIYTENILDLKDAMDKLKEWCSKYKLEINTSKTKLMKIRKGGKLKRSDKIVYNNKEIEFVNEYEYLGVNIQPTLCITKHLKIKAIKATHAMASIKHLKSLSLDTLHKIFGIKIDPIVTYSFNILATDLKSTHLLNLDKIKATFYKRALSVHKSSSNTLIFHMTGVERYGESIIARYGNMINPEHIEKYRNIVEEKNMIFTVSNFTDGPAFKSNMWKNHCQQNRHLITRYTVHGFHHKICWRKEYHTEFDHCICNLCNQPITCRYHLDTHIQNGISLTALLMQLDSG